MCVLSISLLTSYLLSLCVLSFFLPYKLPVISVCPLFLSLQVTFFYFILSKCVLLFPPYKSPFSIYLCVTFFFLSLQAAFFLFISVCPYFSILTNHLFFICVLFFSFLTSRLLSLSHLLSFPVSHHLPRQSSLPIMSVTSVSQVNLSFFITSRIHLRNLDFPPLPAPSPPSGTYIRKWIVVILKEKDM